MSESSTKEALEEALTGKYESIALTRCGAPVEGKRGRKVTKPNRIRGSHEFTPEPGDKFLLDNAIDIPLHGARPPEIRVMQEKPEHRLVVMMVAQGMSLKEVFLQLGGVWKDGQPVSGTGKYGYQYLCQLRRQPWFQANVVKYIEDQGKDRIAAVLEAEAQPALEELIRIAHDPNERGSVRLNACNSLLDRHLGKPTQKIEQETKHTIESFERDAEKVQEEIEKLEAEEKLYDQAE